MSLLGLNDYHQIGIVGFIGGFIWFLIVFQSRRRYVHRFESGVRTSAKVVSVSNFNMNGSTFCRFELEFEEPGGRQITATTEVGRRALVASGDFDELIDGSPHDDAWLSVVYDPDHPHRVDIEAVLNARHPERGALAIGWFWWVAVGVWIGAGLGFMVLGWY